MADVPRRPRRFVITTTAALNGGDAALLEAEIACLERAFGPVELSIHDQQAGAAGRHLPHLVLRPSLVVDEVPPRGRRSTVALRWSARLLRLLLAAVALRIGWRRGAAALVPEPGDLLTLDRYRTADAVVTNPGTMLVPQYWYVPRLVDYLIVLVLGRPLVLFTQTMGPFPHRARRVVLRFILRRATLVLVRGRATLDDVRALGVRGDHVRLAADPVFAFADAAADERGRTERLPDRPAVAVSVRTWLHQAGGQAAQDRYERAVGEACTALVRRHGARICFVSTCQGAPEYHFDDAEAARRIADALPPDVAERCSVDGSFHTTAELRAVLARHDLVLATRLHAAILALTVGTPAIPIAYEPKTGEVFERLGVPSWSIDIGAVDGGRLTRHVEDVLPRIDEARDGLFDAVARERDDALSVTRWLVEALPPVG